VEGVIVIESSSSMKQGDPLGGLLFFWAHYWALLKTIARAPNYVFPSLADDMHIMGPMNEITHAFDHFSTQLTLVGFRVKVSKCKLWNPSGIFSRHRNSSRLHFNHRWLMHFVCVRGFLKLCHTFFGWCFISRCGAYWWSSSPRKRPNCFGHFIFMCSSLTFLSHTDNTFFFFLLIFFCRFRHENYASMWGHYGSKIVRVFSRPFNEALGLTTNILWWYRLFFYGRLCLICFSKNLGFGGSIFVF
jgi:hypothetical protein